MFILSAALDRTGGIAVVGSLMSRLTGQSTTMMFVTLMACVVVTSALINNTPVVIILTPVMNRRRFRCDRVIWQRHANHAVGDVRLSAAKNRNARQIASFEPFQKCAARC